MTPGRTFAAVAGLACALLLCSSLALAGGSKMRSTKIGNKLCQTTGGGKIVPIPGFPGERADRRLLRDIRWMRKRWKIFVTDGYSRDSVHSVNGEHPLGLALDIVPDKARGGTWKMIDRLAAWAEPQQNRPRAPFRWVGYDGDSGHGHGHHLHLSWDHSAAKPFTRARSVMTVQCPKKKKKTKGGDSGGTNGGKKHDGAGGKNGGKGGKKNDGKNGGVPGQGGGGSGGSGSGGLNPRLGGSSASSVETGGISLR